MKLFTTKRRHIEKSKPDQLSIGKSTITLRRDIIERLDLNANHCYAGLGTTTAGRLAIFISREANVELYKLQKNLKVGSNLYMSITKSNRPILKPYIGTYYVNEPKLVGGIFECVLLRTEH